MPRRARAGDGLAAALKRVVKSVETTLGAVITEAEGQDLFDVVEAVRLEFVPSREDSGTNPAYTTSTRATRGGGSGVRASGDVGGTVLDAAPAARPPLWSAGPCSGSDGGGGV